MLTMHDHAATGCGLSPRTGAGPIGERTVWIDLVSPTPEEDESTERALSISVPTRDEMREIEASNRFYLENGAAYMTAYVIHNVDDPKPDSSTVTFILTANRLVTVRYSEIGAFAQYRSQADKGLLPSATGGDVMLGLVETIVARIADLIERMQDEVERLTHQLFELKGGQGTRNRRLDVVLKSTGRQGDMLARAQESLMSLDRVLHFMHQFEQARAAPKDLMKRIVAGQRDLTSLSEHTTFLSERTTFLLNATLGMISTEQNQIIKLFSVMAVMLMPPTLVASVYGMNFKHMPELDWQMGYPWALGLMVLSGLIPFVYFKRKGWL